MGDSLLNFSDLLRRIGVMNRTSVDLAETVRMTVQASDLSHLAPAIPVPIGTFTVDVISAGANFNQAAIQCSAPGGYFVVGGQINGGSVLKWWIADANPFLGGATTLTTMSAASRLQTSIVARLYTGVTQAPANGAFGIVRGTSAAGLTATPMLIRGGDFLLLEDDAAAVAINYSFTLQEIPAPSRLPATV